MCVTLQAGPLEVRLIAATNYELGANICVRLLHENSKAICSFVFSSATTYCYVFIIMKHQASSAHVT